MINITFNVSCLAYSFPHPSHKKAWTANISHIPYLPPLCFPSQTPTPHPHRKKKEERKKKYDHELHVDPIAGKLDQPLGGRKLDIHFYSVLIFSYHLAAKIVLHSYIVPIFSRY